MIEHLVKINPELFQANNTGKQRENFDYNILYINFKEGAQTEISLLTENSSENEFLKKIESIPYFEKVVDSIEPFESLYEKFSSEMLLFVHRDTLIDARQTGNNDSPLRSLQSWTPTIAYFSKTDTFLKNFFNGHIVNGSNPFDNNKAKPRAYFKMIEEYLPLEDYQELLKSIDEEDFRLKQEQLELEKKAVLVFININNGLTFSEDEFRDNALYYFNEKNDITNLLKQIPQDSVCKSCGAKNDLTLTPYYSKRDRYPSKFYNLTPTSLKKDYKDDNSLYLCKTCNVQLSKSLSLIKSYKKKNGSFYVTYDKLAGEYAIIHSLSDLHKDKDNRKRLTVFSLMEPGKQDDNSGFSLKMLFSKNNVNSRVQSRNFELLTDLFLFDRIKKDSTKKNEPSWLDKVYPIKKDKNNEVDDFIYSNRKFLLDFWLENKPIPRKVISKLLYLYINSIEKSWFKSFKFKKLLDFSNNKNVILSEIKKEKNMFDLHNELNNKLLVIDDNPSEFIENQELSDEEYWTLLGRVFGYLKSKSLSQRDDLSYIGKLRSTSKRAIFRELMKLFELYSHSINDNQIKFKVIFALILEEFEERSTRFDENKRILIIVGAMNSKVIKLIKQGAK